MKRIPILDRIVAIVIFFVLLIAVGTCTAQSYIGYSKDQIKKSFTSPDVELITDSSDYIAYRGIIFDDISVFYLDQRDICRYICYFYKYEHLNTIVSIMNEHYYHYEAYKWLDYTKEGIYEYQIDKKEDLFILKVTYKGE